MYARQKNIHNSNMLLSILGLIFNYRISAMLSAILQYLLLNLKRFSKKPNNFESLGKE